MVGIFTYAALSQTEAQTTSSDALYASAQVSLPTSSTRSVQAQVSLSQNKDNIDEYLRVTLTNAKPNTQYVLFVFSGPILQNNYLHYYRSNPTTSSGSKVAFAWNGLTNYNDYLPAGPYRAAICPYTGDMASYQPVRLPVRTTFLGSNVQNGLTAIRSKGTIGDRLIVNYKSPSYDTNGILNGCSNYVAVQKDALPVYIDNTASYAPGQKMNIYLDKRARFAGNTLSATIFDQKSEKAITATATLATTNGVAQYTIPANVPAGMYRLRINKSGEYRLLPLVVHKGAIATTTSKYLVIIPSITWQAYNSQDQNGDGSCDNWYCTGSGASSPAPIKAVGPYQSLTGLTKYGTDKDWPYNSRFMEWFAPYVPQSQFVSDVEAAKISQAEMNKYKVIVFPGHTEYTPQALFDKTLEYKRKGGKLLFLAPNNFNGIAEVSNGNITLVKRRQLEARHKIPGSNYKTSNWNVHQNPEFWYTAKPLACRSSLGCSRIQVLLQAKKLH